MLIIPAHLKTLVVVALIVTAGIPSWGRPAGNPEPAVSPTSAARSNADQRVLHLDDMGNFLRQLTPSRRAASRELLKAAERKDFERVRALAASGKADVNAKNDHGWTALTFAVMADDIGTVRLLLERGADPNTRENDSGSVDIGNGVRALQNGNSVLHSARNAEIARLLLDYGADVNVTNRNGFRAIHFSSADKTKLLLERGADPNARQGASRSERGAFPGDETTALMTASRSGKHDAVRVLIAGGADINARDRWGYTALHSATGAMATEDRANNLETIRVLLASGADPNARNSEGLTPLMQAARSVYPDAIQLLLGGEADPSFCDSQGRTAADYLTRASRDAGPRSPCAGVVCNALIEKLQGDTPGKCPSLPAPAAAIRPPLTSGVTLGIIQFALDMAVLVILAVSPILLILITKRSQRDRGQIRNAYLGYALCALVVGLFQFHLYVDGPDIFMMFGLFLVPIVIAGVLAFSMTIVARSNVTLWILGGATLALGLFQVLTFMNVMGTFMNVVARAYVILILAICAYRRCEWWPASDRPGALTGR
jgi:ankyrin repeat protein